MSDALLIALITGGFGLIGKVVDVLVNRAKTAEAKPKRKRRGDAVNPLTAGGILNPATAILLVVGIVFGVAAATVYNHPPTETPPGTPTATATATATVTATNDTNILTKGGQARVYVTGGDRLLIHELPDFKAKVVARLNDGTVVTLVDGPRLAGADHWWFIQMEDLSSGWAVETFEGIDTLVPYNP